MRALLAPLALASGCLDFSILETPLDGGPAAQDAAPDLTQGTDMAGCGLVTGGPSECTFPTDCPPVHDCVNSGTGTPAMCLAQCSADDQCSCAGSFCVNVGGGDSFCSRYCVLVPQLGCLTGTTCDTVGDFNQDRGFTFCRGAGVIATGSPCMLNQVTACGPGDHCTNTDTGPRCLKWCRLGGSDCPMDQGCYPPTPAVEYLGINYGSCM